MTEEYEFAANPAAQPAAGTTPQAERPTEKVRKAREIDIKNLRFYAKLFEEHKWDTPNISTNVFPATLRDIADRIESAAGTTPVKVRDRGWTTELSPEFQAQMEADRRSEGTTPQAERRAFEKWAEQFSGLVPLDRKDDNYRDLLTHFAWLSWQRRAARAVALVETPPQEANFKQRTIDCAKELREHYNSDWDSTVPGAEFDAEIIRILHRHFDRVPSKTPAQTRLTAEQFADELEETLHDLSGTTFDLLMHEAIKHKLEAFRGKSEAGLREENERLTEGERSVREFLERDYGVSEITTICSRYDDAEQELTELRAKLTEITSERNGLWHEEREERHARERAEAELAALRERERWIPVEEKLPEKQVMVMVSNPDWPAGSPIMMMGHIDGLGKWCGHYTDTKHCGWGSNQPWAMADPTHWKALSAAPERPE